MKRILFALLLPLSLLCLCLGNISASPIISALCVALFALWLFRIVTMGQRPGFLFTDPAGTFNDGGLVFGTQDFTIGDNTYTAVSINIKKGSDRIVSKNSVGVPAKQAFAQDVPNGSVEVQFPDADTPSPALFDQIALTPNGGDEMTFVVSEVGEKYEQFGESMISLTVYQLLN